MVLITYYALPVEFLSCRKHEFILGIHISRNPYHDQTSILTYGCCNNSVKSCCGFHANYLALSEQASVTYVSRTQLHEQSSSTFRNVACYEHCTLYTCVLCCKLVCQFQDTFINIINSISIKKCQYIVHFGGNFD